MNGSERIRESVPANVSEREPGTRDAIGGARILSALLTTSYELDNLRSSDPLIARHLVSFFVSVPPGATEAPRPLESLIEALKEAGVERAEPMRRFPMLGMGPRPKVEPREADGVLTLAQGSRRFENEQEAVEACRELALRCAQSVSARLGAPATQPLLTGRIGLHSGPMFLDNKELQIKLAESRLQLASFIERDALASDINASDPTPAVPRAPKNAL